MSDVANSAAKQRGRPFRPGESGNPAGKPKGTRHRATLAAEILLDGEAETLTRKAIALALDGDTTALRLCLERLVPPRKERPVIFALPPIATVSDLPGAIGALLEGVATGEITPSEAAQVAGIVETYRRAVETTDIERRLAALEHPDMDLAGIGSMA